MIHTMIATTLGFLSAFSFVAVLCVAAGAIVCGTLVLCQFAGLTRVYERVLAKLDLGWGVRSVLSLVSLSMLTIVATWLLGAIDPARYLSPGVAAVVYSAMLFALPVYAIVMPVDRSEESKGTQSGDATSAETNARRAA